MDELLTDPLTFLTDFGDQAVILPVVLSVALVLWAQRRWWVAAAWLLAIPGVLGTILVLKVACYACGWLLPMLGLHGINLRSPSGHAASAAVVYGGVAALIAAHWRFTGWRRTVEGPAVREGHARHAAPAAAPDGAAGAASARLTAPKAAVAAALAAALGAAAVVGVTRVQLGAHSRSEVLLAAIVGVAGAVAFAWLAGRRIAERSGLPAAAVALLVLALFHGRHLPAESVIQKAASEFVRSVVTACQPG